MMLRWVAILVCIMGLTCAHAAQAKTGRENADAQFAQANALFQQQKFEEARVVYKSLLDGGYRTPTVLYNLGTAEARSGRYAEAYSHLLAAQRLNPRSETIQANLNQVLENLFPQEAKRPMPSGWVRASMLLTASEWTMVIFVLLVAACSAAALAWTLKSATAVGLFRATAGMALVVLVLALPFALTTMYHQWFTKKAVVISTAEVRSGPNERFAVIESVRPATIVKVLGLDYNGYHNVKTESGRIGYVAAGDLQVI